MKKLFILLPLIVFGACTKFQMGRTSSPVELSPADTVKTFVELSASAKTPEDRKKLLEACGGDFKKAFERMSDEEFKLTYLSGDIKVEKFEVLDTSTQADTSKVHYRVMVENKQGTETTQESNEREAELRKEAKGWVIEAIRVKGSDKVAFTRGMMF